MSAEVNCVVEGAEFVDDADPVDVVPLVVLVVDFAPFEDRFTVSLAVSVSSWLVELLKTNVSASSMVKLELQSWPAQANEFSKMLHQNNVAPEFWPTE